MLVMSKEKSTFIKGIVILMMLFLHLFNGQHTELCENFVYIAGKPLALWIVGACGPVSFFLLLSGYGLAYTYEHGGISFLKQGKRILKLYIHYWVVLLIFLSIGYYMRPAVYPGSLSVFLANLTGWSCSYVAEMWFIFPYMLVCMASKYIIRFIDRIGNLKAALITLCIYIGTCFLISRYGELYFYNNMLAYQPLLFFHFLYDFTMGVVLYRATIEVKLNFPVWKTLLCIFLLVIVVCIVNSAAIYPVYVPLLVVLLNSLPYPQWLEQLLTEVGRKSMAMWMIHPWFCYYLFQPQIYAFRYPLLIFAVLVVVSYLVAIPVMWIARHIIKLVGLDGNRG